MKDLIARLSQGDRMAAAEIYTRTYKELYCYCFQICKNDFDSQDLVHDTYLTAFEKINQYRYDNNFKGWLHMIALHKYYNKRRREKPHLWSDAPVNIPYEEELICPEEYAENRELCRYIVKIISDRLTEPQRLTVIMFYYDEKSVSEIAEILECAEGTVKSRLYYSRKIMRDELEKNGYTIGGNMLIVASALNRNAGEFIAETVIDTELLTSLLKSKTIAKRFAKSSVKSFAKGKLLAGAAVIAVAGGTAVISSVKNDGLSTAEKSSSISVPETSVKKDALPLQTDIESAADSVTGPAAESAEISLPGGEPVEYDFPAYLFTAAIPENYRVELAAAYLPDGELTSSDKERSEKAEKDRIIMSLNNHVPARFRPDKFSGDIVIITRAAGRERYSDLEEILSGFFSDISVGESSAITFPADTANDPDASSAVSGERTAFTAKSRGHDAVGTAVRCDHCGNSYIFIFADCSGIRQDEYNDIISSVKFRYRDNSWKENYPHFQE